jgi:hypothetical protein
MLHAFQRLARMVLQPERARSMRDLAQLQNELAHALADLGSGPQCAADARVTARTVYLLSRAAMEFLYHGVDASLADGGSEEHAADAGKLLNKAVLTLLAVPAAGDVDLDRVRDMAEAATRGGCIDYSAFGQLFLECVSQIYRRAFSPGFPWSACGTEGADAAAPGRNRPDDARILASGFDVLAVLRGAAETRLGDGEAADRFVLDAMLRFLDEYDPQAVPSGIFALPFAAQVDQAARLQGLKQALSLQSRPYLEIATRFHVKRLLAEADRLHGDVLIVDDGESPLRKLANGTHRKYWLPLAIVEGFAFSFLRDRMSRGIDLSVVVLPFDDIAKFASIYRAIEPMMKPGGKVVLYSLNPNGVSLPSTDPVLIRGLFPIAGMTRIAYTGSAPAVWVLRLRLRVERLVSRAASSRLHIEFARALHLGTRLISGYAGWYERTRQHTHAPPKNVAAICLEVSVP